MSIEEQDSAIGKLSRERTQAKRESALLLRQIKDTGKALSGVTHILMMEFRPDLPAGLKEVDKLISAGGLDYLKKTIAEYLDLQRKIAEISASLRDAGAE